VPPSPLLQAELVRPAARPDYSDCRCVWTLAASSLYGCASVGATIVCGWFALADCTLSSSCVGTQRRCRRARPSRAGPRRFLG